MNEERDNTTEDLNEIVTMDKHLSNLNSDFV